MSRYPILILVSFIIGGLATGANAGELHPGYLPGLWSLESDGKCDQGFEYARFHPDGTFKTGKGDKVESVGFWRIYKEDDDIDLHMVTSPGLFGEEYAEFKGRFTYLDLKALPYEIRKDQFKGVASFGSDLERFTATRCK